MILRVKIQKKLHLHKLTTGPGPLARAISQSRPLGYNSTANACVKGRQGGVPDGDLVSWTEDARRWQKCGIEYNHFFHLDSRFTFAEMTHLFGLEKLWFSNHISTVSIHRNILLTIFYHHISWYPNNDLIVGSYPIWILKESSRFFVSIHFTGSIHCFNWLDPSCLLATPVWVCRKVQWWVVGVPPKFIVDHLFSYSTGNLGVYPFLDAHQLEYMHRSFVTYPILSPPIIHRQNLEPRYVTTIMFLGADWLVIGWSLVGHSPRILSSFPHHFNPLVS